MKNDASADVVSRRAASIVIVISNSLVSFAFQLSPSCVRVTEVLPGRGRAGASLRRVSRQPSPSLAPAHVKLSKAVSLRTQIKRTPLF